jgi:hypothetical protein
MRRTIFLMGFASFIAAGGLYAQGFKFSNEDQSDKVQQAEREAKVQSLLATPCRDKIKNQKIMVLIGEDRNGVISAKQAAYSTHIDAINNRLRSLGLRIFSPEEIRRQVAQAEIDAYFKNDPDAAISASKRLAAQYILRGLIATQASRNAIVNVNQVSVTMISQTGATNESYAGRDTNGMALTLINERADEVVAQLYNDYCRKAGAR